VRRIDMAANLLKLDIEADENVVVIRCHGELDLSVADDLRAAIERLSRPGLMLLRIDATNLSFMDSSGIHCLIETGERCQEHGTRLEVIPSRPVERLLEIAGGAMFPGSLVTAGTADPEPPTSGMRCP
jgi:stage II sporulation protein AA (anti-sigma F factor antagonist)